MKGVVLWLHFFIKSGEINSGGRKNALLGWGSSLAEVPREKEALLWA
jgi:hypothetical protein